jgi:hypothetical protein
MTERSPETAIADVSPQAVNGATGMQPFANPEADHATLAPGEEATEAVILPFAPGANGSPQESPPGAGAAETRVSPEPDGTRDGTQQAAAPAPATPDAETPQSAAGGEVHVGDIRKNQPDSRGEKVEFVFFRRRNCFAIYRSSGRIMVQYADDETEAKKQVANIAELLPLRDRLQYLVSDIESPDAYRWQIAESLRLGLDGQKDAAKSTMQAAIDHIIAKRVSDGRTAYLLYAGLLVIGAIAMLGAVAAAIGLVGKTTPEEFKAGLGYLMLATGSGAMGAMLSTAIALRARTVATDDSWKSNTVDSAMRIMIGVISAAVLYLLLDSQLLAKFSLSTEGMTPAVLWKAALLIGFLAGFLERLVPDLLENKLAPAMAK